MNRTRSSNPGGTTAVADNDVLGVVNFAGADGTNISTPAGRISCEVDGPVAAGNVPGSILFSTRNSSNSFNERIRIDNGGRLLVGSSKNITTQDSLSARLQVVGTGADSGILTSRWSNNSSAPRLVFAKSRGAVGVFTAVANGDNLGWMSFEGSNGTEFIDSSLILGEAAGNYSGTNAPGRLRFFVRPVNNVASGIGDFERMRIDPDGKVGIGTANPDQLLSVNGNASKVSGGSWATFSDERIKTNITLADTSLCYNVIKNLPLKRYTYRDDIFSHKQAQDRTKLGWIAQDVQPFFPKAIYTSNQTFTPTGLSSDNVVIENCLTLDGDQIYATMYGAIQKLISVVETQSQTISALETRLQILENK
jgi:hypothetical protein